MLNSIRKFSNSPYAKIMLVIVILPFVLWGMGDVFRGGKQNTIVEIDKKNVSAQEFGDYINLLNLKKEELNDNVFRIVLSNFVAKNLISTNAKDLNITVTDASLARIIKNDKSFEENNNFSRTKYEKFLISSKYNAYQFESYLKDNETRDQLLYFISGGIKSPIFLINKEYDSKNQTRNLSIINLNEDYKKKLDFSKEAIDDFYKKNIKIFSDNFKSVKYSFITPELITGETEYNNVFFEKLDQIEDLINSDIGIEEISNEFNLPIKSTELFNIEGKNVDGKSFDEFSIEVINKIFKQDLLSPAVLINQNENYLIVKVIKNDNVAKNINSTDIRNTIKLSLKKELIANENSEILKKIITSNFTKQDFDNFANENSLEVQKIKVSGINDTKKIDKNLLENIYLLPEGKSYVFSDSELKDNILVYVDEIKHVKINPESGDYKKHFEATKDILISNIYSTYDKYLNTKYKVNINNNAVERVKNYFK